MRTSRERNIERLTSRYLPTLNCFDRLFHHSETHSRKRNCPLDQPKHDSPLLTPLFRPHPETPHPHRPNHSHNPRNHPLHQPRRNPKSSRDQSKYRCHHYGKTLPSVPHRYRYIPKLEAKPLTGHQIPPRHRLPNPNLAPRALPQMGEHESQSGS
jgi:hypothetical protein